MRSIIALACCRSRLKKRRDGLEARLPRQQAEQTYPPADCPINPPRQNTLRTRFINIVGNAMRKPTR